MAQDVTGNNKVMIDQVDVDMFDRTDENLL